MNNFDLNSEQLAPVREKLARWAAGPNPAVNTPDDKGRIAGFGQGFWHGLTAPIAFVISLFKENVHVYEVHNNGKPYIGGFLLGMMMVWGGSRAGGARRR